MNPLWNVYKSKVMNTFNPNSSDDPGVNAQEQQMPEEVVTEVPQENASGQEDEMSNTVSQLAKKMQGAGAMGWKSMSALFNKEDEQPVVQKQDRQPAPDHPLAVRPQEDTNKGNSGFWDSFANKWQQAAGAESGMEAEQSSQGYVPEGGGNEDAPSFKWDFVTSKLADLKTKSMTKTT